MGRWTLGQGRWGARRTDWREGPALRPTLPCHSPLWDKMPSFFPCPPLAMFHPRVNRLVHIQTHKLMVQVRKEKKAIAAICCVYLRISLLLHDRSFQEEEAEKETSLCSPSPPFFSSSLSVFYGEWCARVKVYIPNGTTCAKNACICNTESGLRGSFSTKKSNYKSSADNNSGLSTNAKIQLLR